MVIVKRPSLGIKNAVEGIKRQQLDVIFATPVGDLKQLIKHVRGGDDRWPAVELKTIYLILVGPAAQLIPLFKEGHLMPFGRQTNGGAQPAKPATDNDNLLSHDTFLRPLNNGFRRVRQYKVGTRRALPQPLT